MPAPSLESRLQPLFGAVLRPIRAFLALEASSGILLLSAAIAALCWVNLGGIGSYNALLSARLVLGAGDLAATFSLHELVNDGLVTIFFFVVGMEIKRELVLGELASFSRALLPAVAALGGMVVPALIFVAFNGAGPARRGWGIPMATDIAFCIGVLTLLKSRVSYGLIVFVTALAIFDDIGGILVIALFYGHGLDLWWLALAAAVSLVAFGMGRAEVKNGFAWAAVGALLWLALHRGGIHATIAGVVIGLCVPARPRTSPRLALMALAGHLTSLTARPVDEALDTEALGGLEQGLEALESPIDRFLHLLHPWTAFLVMPVFALANSGVDVRNMSPSQLASAVTLGTAAALVGGKLVGIFSFTVISVRLGLAPMPGGASHAKLLGAAVIAGIGFTVALFIAGLAYPDHPDLLDQAKLGILAGSVTAGIAGAVILLMTPRLSGA